MGPRAGLDTVEKIKSLASAENRTLNATPTEQRLISVLSSHLCHSAKMFSSFQIQSPKLYVYFSNKCWMPCPFYPSSVDPPNNCRRRIAV
jgi:hypothetical protein